MTTIAPEVLDCLAEGIRAGREAAGLSVRGLARAVGVSPSLVSQIERGKVTPSIGTLYVIVAELGISMDELLFGSERGAREDDPPGTSVGGWMVPSDGLVLHRSNRLSLTLATGVRWERLTAQHDPRVEFLYVTYPVGSESCPSGAPMRHGGWEYGLMLSGRLGATVGEEYYELRAGDSIAVDPAVPHRLWNLGEVEATAVWTVLGRDRDPRGG